ncbi:MAG TPA: Na(+)/H(+) antiporter subunit A [Verrucomicrobia bacterium]|nr:MAG: hypothetical protein A2X46_09285 [Lentisphaerae bacterium GWF2_57_35]HBA84437.1 Na(+)/H(+) antiporter subunit A [Verrucomicrobiota bacterium]
MLYFIAILFVTALISVPLCRWLPKNGGWFLALAPAALFVYLCDALASFPQGVSGQTLPWFPGLHISLAFRLDGLSLLFALLISGIGFLVALYIMAYMSGNARQGLFYAYHFFFMGSMIGVVTADDLLLLFVFWELTSVSSFLLIGFHHERAEARRAALQSILVTGLGGLALLAGVLMLGLRCGTFRISEILLGANHQAFTVPILAAFLLAAFTKSAQFPFHFWLPNAMEAPTPASAYLHSSTMVKAGLYLLARFQPIGADSPVWFWSLFLAGACTALLGAVLALRQTVFKRLLAFSTVSALGLLTLQLSVPHPLAAAAFAALLVAHAFYKGALFLVAGAVDHAVHETDLRRLAGLYRLSPFLVGAAALAAASLAGIPGLLNFTAKEFLYDFWGRAGSLFVPATLILMIVSALYTVAALLILRPFFAARAEDAGVPLTFHSLDARLWVGPVVLGAAGLLFGIFPQRLLQPLVSAVCSAMLLTDEPVHLEAWPGWNLQLALSLAAVAVGVLLFVWRAWRPLRKARLALAVETFGDRAYDGALRGLFRVAHGSTRILQHGYLRLYLLVILLATVVLVGVPLTAAVSHLHLELSLKSVRIEEAFSALLVVLGIMGTVHSPSRLAAIISLGVVGYGIATLFLLFGAPDLSMTQFVVETLTVVLLVLAFRHLPEYDLKSRLAVRMRDVLLCSALGCVMAALVILANSFQLHPKISSYFMQNSALLAHGRNVVNVIIVDFRALDTLGEITVLATAGLGAWALLKLRPRKKEATR